MAKTKEELDQLKQEYESLNNKLNELSEEEIKIVTGGLIARIKQQSVCPYVGTSNCKYSNQNKISCPYYNDYWCMMAEITTVRYN